LYIDGMEVTPDIVWDGQLDVQNSELRFSGVPDAFPAYSLDGVLDEARISDIVRSPAWIKATYYSENCSLLSFGIEQVIGILIYSESTIQTQGAYSLKCFAPAVETLDKYVVHDLSTPLDLSGVNSVEFDVRASRIGTNFKLSLRNSNGVWIDFPVNITTANVWQTGIEWDISSVPTENRNSIDRIKITITNADEDNTFYLDNFIAEVSNMMLISNPATAKFVPSKSRVVLFEEDVNPIDVNVDLKVYVSRDDGVTWTQHILSDEGKYGTSQRILSSEPTDISGQSSGTSIRWKITTHNQKNLKIHGIGVQWQ